MKVGVIGAGFSGFVVSILLKRKGIDVLLIEHTDSPLKKVLSTGAGKCNYTNKVQDENKYFPKEAFEIIKKFDHQEAIKFFDSVGIIPLYKENYVYPSSEQAKSIRDVLVLEAKSLQLEILYNEKIIDIFEKDRFLLSFESGRELEFDKLIFATGSKAFSKSGSDGSALKLLKKLKIRYNEFYPALLGLAAKEKKFLKTSHGVRQKAKAKLFVSNELIQEDFGEIQFVENRISGIPIFNLSARANKEIKSGKEVYIELDLLKDVEDKIKFLEERMKLTSLKTAKDLGLGFINDKLFKAILNRAGIKEELKKEEFSKKDIEVLASLLNKLRFNILYTEDFEKAQVCTGGVPFFDLDDNLEHEKLRNLYFVGEIVDVDAICGGYNLQWGFSSASVVSSSINKSKSKSR